MVFSSTGCALLSPGSASGLLVTMVIRGLGDLLVLLEVEATSIIICIAWIRGYFVINVNKFLLLF